MNSIKQKFGKRIRELRKSNGLTQEKLAELIGMETPNVSKMENGLHFPQLENLKKLSLIFNIELKDLFDFEHFNSREELLIKIDKFIKKADNKDIELLYKFITNIQTYRT